MRDEEFRQLQHLGRGITKNLPEHSLIARLKNFGAMIDELLGTPPRAVPDPKVIEGGRKWLLKRIREKAHSLPTDRRSLPYLRNLRWLLAEYLDRYAPEK